MRRKLLLGLVPLIIAAAMTFLMPPPASSSCSAMVLCPDKSTISCSTDWGYCGYYDGCWVYCGNESQSCPGAFDPPHDPRCPPYH